MEYSIPMDENRLGYRSNPSVAIAPKGKEGTAIGVHNVNGDSDATRDLQDQMIHYPVHGTVIMPRLPARTVNPWAAAEPREYLAS